MKIIKFVQDCGVLGSNNALYNYFEGALDKHHGGMSYDEEKWI